MSPPAGQNKTRHIPNSRSLKTFKGGAIDLEVRGTNYSDQETDFSSLKTAYHQVKKAIDDIGIFGFRHATKRLIGVTEPLLRMMAFSTDSDSNICLINVLYQNVTSISLQVCQYTRFFSYRYHF